MALAFTRVRHFERARAVLGCERTVARHRERILGEGPQLDGSAHAMRGADPGDADLRGHRGAPLAYFLSAAAAAAAAVLAAAAEAVAAVAAASAFALRSLRGTAFSGF